MNLLLIERAEGECRAYADLLAALGHEVTVGAAPEAVRERVRTRRVDAVLLPSDAAGFAFAGELQRLWPSLPLIALGAADTALAAAEAAAHGALGYVVLPREGAAAPPMADLLARLVERAGARLRVERDRREALEEDLRTRKFYSDVLSSVGQGILVIDLEGKVRYRNPEAARILGEGDDARRALEAQAAVPILQMLVETITEAETRTRTIALEEEERRVFLDVTTSALRAADGKASGGVAIVSDRSNERNMEQQLFHTERLATLGSLLASIAHEINNTLTSITGCAEMGLELADTAERAAASAGDPSSQAALRALGGEIRQIFDLVLEAGISCQTIADNMLQYSRQGKPSHRIDQDLNDLVRATLRVLGKHLGVEKVNVSLELDPRSPRARIEAAKLQQALVNLIVNAVQALLTLELPREQLLLRIETRRDDEAGTARLLVLDRGPGIPPRRLERIFQPFFTTKGHGAGLGLHITRRVIEDLEGSIDVESKPGEGTCFTITLPLS